MFGWTVLTNLLTRCEGTKLTAAPLDECKLPQLFVIPGDVLTVLHTYGDYADVTYRNPRTGREASGWIKVDRLAPMRTPSEPPV